MNCAKVPSGVRNVKKKQIKDESDRIKQAEKKKRRLEKALATSAAICSELEKKKQKKKEEQQRLDEEGAAIAEAVALHVLLGEDSDDSCKVVLKKDKCNFNVFMGGSREEALALPRQDLLNYSLQGIGWVYEAHRFGGNLNDWGKWNRTVSSNPFATDFQTTYFHDGGWETTEISADLIAAAQAVSSLQIAEDEHVDAFVAKPMFRR